MLRRAGAVETHLGYTLGGRSIRVVNGAGVALSKLKAQFTEAPVLDSADIVVAPGATNLPMPANVVRSGRAGHFIRPVSDAAWFDLEGARGELAV
jgi:hypothetical protein